MKSCLFVFVVAAILSICSAKAVEWQPFHAKGLIRDQAKFDAFLKAHRAPKRKFDAVLPAYVDLSGKAALGRNQGGCGSCWAYSLTGALQSELMINGNGGPATMLDTEYLIGNCGGPVKEDKCQGGDFPAAENLVAPYGAPANGKDPASGRGCPSGPIAGSALSFVMMGGGEGGSSPTDQEMVQALNDGHVISIDLAADDSWSNYPQGATTQTLVTGTGTISVPVWNQTTSTSIDHMIKRVGAICTGEGLSADGKSCVFGADGNSVGIVYIDLNNWGDCTDGASWGYTLPNGHCGYIYETRLANASGTDAGYFTVSAP